MNKIIYDKYDKTLQNILQHQDMKKIVNYTDFDLCEILKYNYGPGRWSGYAYLKDDYIKYLIDNSIDIEKKDDYYNDYSTLNIICQSQNINIIIYYIEKTKCIINEYIIHSICQNNDREYDHINYKEIYRIPLNDFCTLLTYLNNKLINSEDFFVKLNKNGDTPLHILCACGNFDKIKWAIESEFFKVNTKHNNYINNTLLFIQKLCYNYKLNVDELSELINLLRKKFPNIDFNGDEMNTSPLVILIIHGNDKYSYYDYNKVKWAIQSNLFDINKKEYNNNTVIDYLIKNSGESNEKYITKFLEEGVIPLRKYGYLLQYVKNQTIEMCQDAIDHDKRNIRYVKKELLRYFN